MNKKGQVLVMFLIMLPFILILFGYLIDKCYLMYQENRLNNIGDTVCNYALKETNEDKINQLILENDREIKRINIDRKQTGITVTLEKEIDSLFGNVIGINNYKINSNITCRIKGD